MKELCQLFIIFARIGGFTFGGGYAMLPMLQRELVEKHGWTTEEELMDYYAIAQCTPGVIAVNTATLIGRKRKGILGGLAATLGVVFPSFVIISIIAAVLNNFAELPVVKNAFIGIRACVCALILSSAIKLVKKSLIDAPTVVIFVVVLALAVVGNFVTFDSALLNFLFSPIVFVVLSGVAGLCIRAAKGGLRP